EGWSSSPWTELGDWTRFNYVNYNFWEGNNIHWEDFYVSIFSAKQVLTNVPHIPFEREADKDKVIGQAEFLRALWYFQIATLLEKGALVLEPKDGSYKPEEVPEAAIWAQVEADLVSAVAKLPETWDAENRGRATLGAAKALLAKA